MASNNMFALLNDSDSDDEGPKQQQAKPAAAPAKPERKPERKPRDNRRDDRPRAERDDGADKNQNPADRREGGKGDRRRDYGDRREGGKGKSRKGESRGDSGREFPRRSGTGRGRENSRQGSGKYNWGKDTDGQNTSSAEPLPTDAAEPDAEGAEAPMADEAPVVEEEDKTIGFDEWEKAQADKMAELNSLNTYGERQVEQTADDATQLEEDKIEDEYSCMFHDDTRKKKDFGRKQARDGYKQADQVLNLKFVDENADAGKGKGGKGDRRPGGKGERRQTGKGERRSDFNQSAGANKSSIDLSNDAAFPTLGAC